MIDALRFIVSAGLVVVFVAAAGLTLAAWLASAAVSRAGRAPGVVRIKSGRASQRRVIVHGLFHVKHRSGAAR